MGCAKSKAHLQVAIALPELAGPDSTPYSAFIAMNPRDNTVLRQLQPGVFPEEFTCVFCQRLILITEDPTCVSVFWIQVLATERMELLKNVCSDCCVGLLTFYDD